MLNKVILIGRLTANPELRYTPNNTATSSFRLAVDRGFTNQKGEREADFINVVAWGKQAENIKKYMIKGSLISVEGRIQTRNYDNQNGQKVYVTEVVAESVRFLERKKELNDNQISEASNTNEEEEKNIDLHTVYQGELDLSDDLPF